MRLRQICLVAESLAPAVDELCAVLGLGVCHRDTGVAKWGLENAVMPVGGNFLEVVAPTRPDTSAGRYLARRRGDGGYMVILQCADAVAERARITGLGVRAVWTTDRPAYRATHFHPADVGGVLLSVDSVEPGADYRDPRCMWEPAGPEWAAAIRTDAVVELGGGDLVGGELVGAELQSAEPAATAALWSRLLDLPLGEAADGTPTIALDNATVRFVSATDGRGQGLGAIDIRAVDRDRVLAAAALRGAKIDDDRLLICGTRINLV